MLFWISECRKVARMTIQTFWVCSKLTYEKITSEPLAIWRTTYVREYVIFKISRLREHLPWRVDSVNSPCRSKVVSFLKVAIAATSLNEKSTLKRQGRVTWCPFWCKMPPPRELVNNNDWKSFVISFQMRTTARTWRVRSVSLDAATAGASPALGSVTGKMTVVITQMKRTARRKLAHTSRYPQFSRQVATLLPF